MQTVGAPQATPGTILGTGTGAGTLPARSAHRRPSTSAMRLPAALTPGRPPRRRARRARFARPLAVAAAAWIAAWAQAGTAAAQTSCPQDAPYTASFSVTCTQAMTCTFNNTSAPVPSGFASLEWDLGDGYFVQGAAAAMSPFVYTYGATGTFLVTMTLTAGDGQVAVATGSVTFGGPQVPLAADDAFTTPADTPLTIAIAELLANDLPGVTFISVSGCTLSAAGDSCTFPAQHVVGVYGFSYTVQDALGNHGSANVFVTVTQPLVANTDYFSTYIGVPIQITSAQLLVNDVPPTAVFVRAENAVNGSLTFLRVNPQGAAVYQFTPSAGSTATGSFDYLISLDGNPPYATGYAFINVQDHPPIASFQVHCTNRTCTVSSYSTDDVGITTYTWDFGDGTVVTPPPPNQGSDQTHTYAHSGRYTITLTVTDTAGQPSSFQLAVLANTPPTAANVTATTDRDVPVPIDVLAGAADADGDPLTAGADLSAYPGATSLSVQLANGRWGIRITPPDTFVGTMTFPYTVYDPWGGTATATVTLTVKQWTVIVDALGEQFACMQNSSLRIPIATLLANDYHSDPNVTLTIASFDTSVLMGTLDCQTDPTACTYTPPTNAAGFTFFRYTVTDCGHGCVGHEDTATVKIYVANAPPYGHPPTAYDDYFTTARNTPKAFTIQDLVQNDVDPDGDTLSVGLQAGARAYGSLTCSTPMYTCTYTPNAGFVGAEHFSYTASDGLNPASTAWINILTLPPATPTFDAREDVIVTGVNQPATFSSGLLANDYAPSGGPITVTALDTTGLIGSLGCGATSCTYTPPLSFQGTTTFKYTANDGHGATDTAIVKIKVGVTNHPPVAVPQTLSTPRNTALTFSVFQLMQGDYDPDDDPLTVTVYTVTAHLGTVTCSTPNYWCTYTPNAGTTGADVLTYALSDGTAAVTSTVTINITNTTP